MDNQTTKNKLDRAPRPVQWFESLQFRLSIGLLVILGILILAFMTVNQTLLRSVLVEDNFELVEQAGTGLVTELGQQIKATESLTQSIASLGERLPYKEDLYKEIIPHLMDTEGDREIVAGGGIWPEPYKFSPQRKRRSFFWARKYGNELKYYDDYNAPDGLGYHAEEWYVPAKYIGKDRCFWSKSYMDPYSLEPMVTCSVPMHQDDELIGVATVDVRLAGLQQFFASRAEKLGGYAFAVDRNNKFLSYPQLDLVTEDHSVEEAPQQREFITVRDFTSKNPEFKPIARELEKFSDQLLDLARSHPQFDPKLSDLIANESYQINRHEAQMITATFIDPLSSDPTTKPIPFETSIRFSMEDDMLLNEPVLVSVFMMPKVYWKIVVVTPQRPVIDKASEVTGKILFVLIAIILVSIFGAYIWLRKILVHPLVTMTNEIRDAPLSGPAISTPDQGGFTEINVLGTTLNRMRDQLSSSFSELQASENRFRLIAESLPEGLVIARRSDGEILYLNSRLREMFAIPEGHTGEGLKFLDFYDDPKDRAQLLQKLQVSSVVSDFVVPARRYDGSRFWMSVSTSTIVFGGEDALVTGVIDVTKRKQVEDEVTLYRTHLEQMVDERTAELDGARRVALQAAAAKQNFLANMSHEIRTPLNSIIGIGQLLITRDHLPTQNRYLHNLNRAGKALLKIINDILDITRMDMGKLKTEAVEFDLDDVLDDISIHIRPLLAEQKIDTYIMRPVGLNRRLVGDPLKLGQVILNLLTNAIKFTKEGYVQCQVEIREHTDQSIKLHFNVCDTGIGIPAEKLSSIFNAFTQADSATTREYGGTGLGLAISKTLVGLMGGDIKVDSTVGKGSSFQFEIPFILSETPSRSAASRLDQEVRALILSNDDHEIEALERQLGQLGINADAIGFDPGAVDSLKNAEEAGQPYQLIFLDWDAPESQKAALMESFSKSPDRSKFSLIALTHSISDQDEKLLDQQTLNAVISRPARQSRLRTSIATVLNLDPDHNVNQRHERYREKPLKNIRILHVEDNEQNQIILGELLGDAGAEITIADNGQVALDILNGKSDHFDLVLMDLHMPVMDGLEATAQIRRDFSPDQLPIIALTADVFEEVIEKCLSHGMNDYLSKPIELERAIEVITTVLRIERAHESTTEREDSTIPDHWQHISVKHGLANLDGKHLLYRKMLTDFCDKYDDFEADITTMDLQHDKTELARYIHTFCGLAGTIGARGIESHARLLSRSLKSHGKTSSHGELSQLIKETSQLLNEIKSILKE